MGGGLSVEGNDVLTNVDGFQLLTSVGDYLAVSANEDLTNVDGFQSLTSVGGYLRVNDNDALTNITGLSHIGEFGGNYVRVCSNAHLTSIPDSIIAMSVGFISSQNCIRTGAQCCA